MRNDGWEKMGMADRHGERCFAALSMTIVGVT